MTLAKFIALCVMAPVVLFPAWFVWLILDDSSTGYPTWKFVALLSRSGKRIEVHVLGNSSRNMPFLRMPRSYGLNSAL